MSPEIISIFQVIKKEVWRKRRLMLLIYVMCSALFLVAALMWPKIYTSSSTILVDQQNILRPLMAGTAETTQVVSRARMANKIIFSQKSLKEILESETWQELIDNEQIDGRAIERMGQRLSGSTRITDAGENLIEISFSSNEPMRAFETTQLMTEIFITQSLETKQAESQAAYQFIDDQVTTYHNKLKTSENALKDFRSKNIDASEGAKLSASARLIELKRELEGIELDISTTQASVKSYKKQLSGETQFTDQTSIVRENQLNERINSLEQRLAELKLNYHDSYPDVVQLKGQISDLKLQLKSELADRKSGTNNGANTPSGETVQLIQSQIFTLENNVTALETRKSQILRLMNNERDTLADISDVETEVSELTRDYEVNQEMYQSLLNQRENARISMNIDLKNQGLTLKVQEPASIPVTPKGIRFAHIILAGLVLSFIIPVAIIYGLTLLDQKYRTESAITSTFEIPVLATVNTLTTTSDQKKFVVKMCLFITVVLLVWSTYGSFIYMKIQG